MNCVSCGSERTSWQHGWSTDWMECRGCGYVWLANDEREYYDEPDEADPALNMREEWTWVRDQGL